jgi:hypothetical protein
MKIAPLAIAFFAAAAIAVPTPEEPKCDPQAAEVLDLLRDMAPYLDADGDLDIDIADIGKDLGKRQGVPTQAVCYGLCDKGPKAMRPVCALLPVSPIKLACYAGMHLFGTPGGEKLCRQVCNIFA